MSDCATCGGSACRCETVAFPRIVCNLANQAAIAYRIGDYVSFRHRLLQALPDEVALTIWQPGAEGDLAVQMLEWWAYLADVLTFYNERIANEAYLGTAQLPESVSHLVQLLGTRPRPALGARGQLAALLGPGARVPLSVPAGTQVQSKPGPGQSPQTFEVDADTTVQSPDAVAAIVVPADAPLLGAGHANLWLAGKVSGIKPGDRLLLSNARAITAQTLADFAWIKVSGTTPQTDPLGNAVTQVAFATINGNISPGAQAAEYVLLRSGQSSPLWGYSPSPAVITATSADLASIARGMAAGSLALFDMADTAAGLSLHAEKARPRSIQRIEPPRPTPVIVTSYAEVVWYANGNGTTPPSPGSPSQPVPAVAIPHSEIGFATLAGDWEIFSSQVTVRSGWTPVGTLVPVLSAADLAFTGGDTALVPTPGAPAFPATAVPVLLEDPKPNGASAVATPASAPPGAITLGQLAALPADGLASPITVFFDQVPVSRGKTVPSEILGSGNPQVAGQDFALTQSPVTYFADPASISGDGFSSTVRISVNGLQWREVQSFYGQGPNAQVFVLREDDRGITHATFGDGVNGARLPTGSNNVIARYRVGAGAAQPAIETLTVVQNPVPGLKGLRNPLPPTGGTDADPASKLRKLAPASILTFDRAVALDDYAAIAARASGVTQAVAEYVFDPLAQRPVVTLWIAGDAGAVSQATAALAGLAMPNQDLRIKSAAPVEATLTLTYVRDARFDDATMRAALTAALLDPDDGLLGANVLGIGQAVYQSQIDARCLAVPGVKAVRNVALAPVLRFRPLLLRWTGRRIVGFGQPPAPPPCSGQRYDPGAGSYFSIPDDGRHLTLNGGVAA